MNRPPAFILHQRSGVWHRFDRLKLPSIGGESTMCGERFVAVALAYCLCKPVDLICNECEEKNDERKQLRRALNIARPSLPQGVSR